MIRLKVKVLAKMQRMRLLKCPKYVYLVNNIKLLLTIA
jgi:hypothetical protein